MGVDDDSAPGAPRAVRFEASAARRPAPALPVLGATTTPWVLDLIRRFRAAGPTMRVCPHLVEDADEPATWLAVVPELRSCRRPACAAAVGAALEELLGRPADDEPTRCTTCGRVGLVVRGVGVAAGPTMLRGTVCDDCLAAMPIPTASLALDAETDDALDTGRVLRPDGDPVEALLDVDADAPSDAAAARAPSPDVAGRRALRRGWLLARACATTTARGLDTDRAVVAGLLVRTAKLAEGLASPAPADAAAVTDLAFRSLTGTTTALWWLLRADPGDATRATAAYRDGDPGGADHLDDVGARLTDLGRAADRTALVGTTPDASPGSWRELAARHLADRPDGFAVDLELPAPHPLRALVAGEHLSLACADYAARMPVDIDADEVRRLADEVTALRADVERALADDGPSPAPAPAPGV